MTSTISKGPPPAARPTLDCKRAAKILRGLQKEKLQVGADEIEQLIKYGLVVEADPIHLDIGHQLLALRTEFAEHFTGDVLDPAGYRTALTQVEELLKSEWYRIRSSKARVLRDEAARVELRRALGHLADPKTVAGLRALTTTSPAVAPNARYVQCPELGVEVYALTQRGARVLSEIRARVERVGEAPLSWLLKSLDKVDAKMEAFGRDIAHLSKNVGYVKKRPEQVVIGLVKTNLPPTEALQLYRQGMARTNAPDVAVTCARNAAQQGGAGRAAKKLEEAQRALLQAGFAQTPLVLGAAKALLAYDPPSAGVDRFCKLYNKLEAQMSDPALVKYVARLMPAHGRTSEVVDRVLRVGTLLPRATSGPLTHAAISVAIASMVRDAESVEGAVTRFRELTSVLAHKGISSAHNAEEHALECMGCAGSAVEVGATVRALCLNIDPTWPPRPETAAIAVSFAKRFTY